MRCVVGEVFDVAVDILKTVTYVWQVGCVNLSAANKRHMDTGRILLIFLSLTDNTEFCIKTNNFYNRNYERCLNLMILN